VSGRDPWSLVNALVLAAVAVTAVAVWVLAGLGGWEYYTTPMRVRGYAAPHRVLRPSGTVAHPLGVAGLVMMLVPVVYALRKRWAPLARLGSMRGWLEFHIFCGIVGPVLVTFHASFKFNGIISVAYWSMVSVMLSGFVGRYLFVRIPKSIRGVELTHDEILERTERLKRQLDAAAMGPGVLNLVHEVERELEQRAVRSLVGPMIVRIRLSRLRRELWRAGVERSLAASATASMRERLLLLRKLAHLDRTKRLFAMWHVFHQPLVYVMFAIATVHIGVAVYLGYAWW
jgi:hypothetical protein